MYKSNLKMVKKNGAWQIAGDYDKGCLLDIPHDRMSWASNIIANYESLQDYCEELQDTSEEALLTEADAIIDALDETASRMDDRPHYSMIRGRLMQISSVIAALKTRGSLKNVG